MTFGLDVNGHSNYDEGSYCENCDQSFGSDDYDIVPVDQWTEHCACPLCGHVDPQVMFSDYYYDLGLYLLSIADDDFAWPEYVLCLPKYEA